MISKQTLLSKKACLTNTTMGMSAYIYHDKLSTLPPRRTGIVYNVTPSAVGVIVYKIVGNRYIEKRVNVRTEHIKHSKCRQEFLDRVKANDAARAAAKERGGK